jgi:hypothetical protein
MGEVDTKGRYEDVNFKAYFEKVDKLGKSKVQKHYLDMINKRNTENQEWGLKMPNIPHFFQDIKSNIINPVFIISFRNPLTIAQSAGKYGNGWEKKHLDAAINHNQLILNMINSNSGVPCILSSFEDVLKDTEEQVKQLETFLGKSFDLELIQNFLSKKTYTHVTN